MLNFDRQWFCCISTIFWCWLLRRHSCRFLLKYAAQIYVRNMSSDPIGYFVSNQRCFYIFTRHIGKRDVKRGFSCFRSATVLHGGESSQFFLQAKMVYCSAFNCNNDGKKMKHLSFFQFPSDEKYRQIWKEKVRRLNWEPNKYSRLCSAHFEPHCYVHDPKLFESLGLPKPKKVILKLDAVPTIFNYEDRSAKPITEKARKRKREEANGTAPSKGRKILEVSLCFLPVLKLMCAALLVC